MEWETTLEQATVLEKVSDDILVFLQLHKRVWPAAQRDALFWSHMRCIKADNNSQTWIVCNQVSYNLFSNNMVMHNDPEECNKIAYRTW